MHHSNSSRRLRPEELQVDRDEHADWPTAEEMPVAPGDRVWCAGGEAEVVRVLGKTSEGARVLELKLMDGVTKAPFFASAANVLVTPAA